MTCYVCRFVDANGNPYYPAKEVTGPFHRKTFAFTGPKVSTVLLYSKKFSGIKNFVDSSKLF